MKFATSKLLGLGAAVFLLGAPVAANAQLLKTTQFNAGNVVTALNNVNVSINELLELKNLEIGDIKLVDVDNVLNNNNILNNSLNQNRINILQNFLNESLNNNNVQILNNVLNNNDIDIDDVVAIDVLSDGTVVVFHK